MIKVFRRFKLCLLVLVLVLASCTKSEHPNVKEYPAPINAIDISWQHPQADFQLFDASSKPKKLADYHGKVVVLFFGYTHCPEVCPTTLADLAQVMRLLGQDAKKVQVLFVTLDPERDTPDVLSEFIPSFDSSFIGLYGDAQATAQAAKLFGVNYQKQPGKHGGYTLDHSDGTYLIGTEGKPLWLSRYGQPAELLVQDIRLLLASSSR
jgi:protein SCO1/2